jgi:hypothetical protein
MAYPNQDLFEDCLGGLHCFCASEYLNGVCDSSTKALCNELVSIARSLSPDLLRGFYLGGESSIPFIFFGNAIGFDDTDVELQSLSSEEVGFKDFAMSAQLKRTSPNKKNKKTVQKPTSNRVKPARVVDVKGKTQAVFKIPHCAMDYFSSLAAPFETPGGVCIPAEVFPLPSQKIKTFLKGRFQAGTTGIGFITVSPIVTNSGAVITSSTALSVGAPATQFNAFTAVQTLTMPQFPFDEVARTAGGYNSRIVSYGIRIKYIGKLMDRNGVTTSLEEPDHKNMYSLTTTPSNLDRVNGHPQSHLSRVGGEVWDSEIFYSGPVSPAEIEFSNTPFPLGQYISIICVQGEPGDSYEFEYVQHTEVIGTLAIAKTPSHADPATFGKVLESAKTTAIDGPLSTQNSPSFFKRFMDGARELGPAILSGGKMVAAMLSADLPIGLLEAANTSQNLTRAFAQMRGSGRVQLGAPRQPEALMLGM